MSNIKDTIESIIAYLIASLVVIVIGSGCLWLLWNKILIDHVNGLYTMNYWNCFLFYFLIYLLLPKPNIKKLK